MKLWQKVVGAIFGAVGTLFLVVCYLLIFQPQFFMGYDPGEYKADGLDGKVSDLFFIDKDTGIALSSLNHPDYPSSVKIFHTTDAGHRWKTILELPGYSHALNAIKIDKCVFCAIKNDSIYSLLSVDISSGKYKLSNDTIRKLPILFESEGNLGYTANGVFYITDGSFSKTDSIGSYNKIPSNKGIAVIDSHIYGFIFDKSNCVSRLYDFTDDTAVGHLVTPGDASLIKATEKSCLILAANEQQHFMMYDFDGIKKTLVQKAAYQGRIIHPLRIDNGVIYTLVAEAPNTDYYLLIGNTTWESKTTITLCESNIRAYCLIDNVFYYYDFLHIIVSIELNSKVL